MAAPASVRILGVAELPGTIRIAEYPGPKGDDEAGRSLRVGVHDVCEVAVLLLAVQRHHSVAMLA